MSGPRVPHEDNPREAARRGDKRSKKHDHASCDRPPSDPDGLVGTYNNEEGERHGRLQLKVRWNEVTTDTIGNAIKLKKYNLEWQSSKDDGANWRDAGRARVPAKNDDDPGTKDHYSISKIRGRLDYRFRVQAEATGGCRSDWSGWLDVGPAIETPPEVTGLTLDIDEHSAHGKWDLPDDADNPDVKDLRITHVGIELYKGAISAPNLVTDDKHRVSEHWHYKLRTPPGNATFNLRVRTISASGSKSNWVSTSATKNTPSQPAAPAIAFDAGGTRHARFRALVTIAEVADTDFEISYYRVQFVDKSASGTPTSSDDRDHRHVKAKGSNRELVAIFRNVPSEHLTYARTQAVDKDGKESAWSSWAAGGKPVASDTVPALQSITYITNRRRVGVKWKTPLVNEIPDERIAHVHVQIATDNGFVNIIDEAHKHAGHGTHRYAIPIGDASSYYVRLRPIDGAGNLGAWQPSATGHNLTADPDLSSAHAVGEIFTWAGKVGQKPSDTLLCNGDLILKTAWPSLDAFLSAAGYPYGSDATHFGVPDLRRRHVQGADDDSQVGAHEGVAYAARAATHDEHGAHATHGGHNKHGGHATHGGHGAHSGHNPHGAHTTHGAHSAHTGHGGHRTDNVSEATHGHQVGTFGTSSAGVGSASGGTGTPTDLTRIGHGHTVPIHNTNAGAAHAHSHQQGHDSTAGAEGHSAHSGHSGHAEHGSGEHDYAPGSQGHGDHGTHAAHNEHGSGEHDADATRGHGDHSEHVAQEHDTDKPNHKGHRDHPHSRHHHLIQAA